MYGVMFSGTPKVTDCNQCHISSGYCNSMFTSNCPHRFINGLIEYIKEHSYPVRYGTNSTEQGMTITGIEQAIKEYCGENDKTGN